MKRLLFTVFIIHITFISSAQTPLFDQIGPFTPLPINNVEFEGVSQGSLDFADIDNDGDNDVIIIGENSILGSITKLYINDGSDNYTELIGMPFENLKNGTVIFEDVDNDGDSDVLLSGTNDSNIPITKLYIKNSDGYYIEGPNSPFHQVHSSSMDFEDIDGDNDLDLLITGKNGIGQRTSILYFNQGNGVFEELIGSPFQAVYKGAHKFFDMDNDGDSDVIITGVGLLNLATSILYENNGTGVFTEVQGTPFENVMNSSISIADFDNNGTNDIIISGDLDPSVFYLEPITKYYINNGNGTFIEYLTPMFENLCDGSLKAEDVDNDGDLDVLITGKNEFDICKTNLYKNDGSGSFTQDFSSSFTKIFNGDIGFKDIDNDGDSDLLIIGRNEINQEFADLYINDGAGYFLKVSNSPFNGVKNGSSSFSDIDNDNDIDVLITGFDNFGLSSSQMYKNDGFGHFTKVLGNPIENVSHSSVAFEDIDNDGDQDLFISGLNSSNIRISKLYKNDGSGFYTEMIGTAIDPISLSSISFADVDNDNDIDLFISGSNSSGQRISKLYSNDGFGNYTEVLGTPFIGVNNGSIAFSDIDNDNDQDLLITGASSNYVFEATLYENDGLGNFTEVLNTPFEHVSSSSIAFEDINNDGFQDLLITGKKSNTEYVANLYINSGGGNFTQSSTNPFEGVMQSFVAFSDVNNDTNQDVLITGKSYSGSYISKLYRGLGNGDFLLIANTPFDHVKDGTVNFSDINNDSYKDVLITGVNESNNFISKLYKHVDCLPLSGVDVKNGCGTFIWIDGNEYTSSNYSSTFTIPNASIDGCDSILTLNLTFHNPDTTLIINEPSLIASQNSASYQWLDCNLGLIQIPNANLQSYTPETNGYYAVEINRNGCIDTSSCKLISTLEINELSSSNTISIYPNPSSGMFTIDMSMWNNALIRIHSINGDLIHEEYFSETRLCEFEIDIAQGIYQVIVSNGKKTKHLKLIIN